MSTEGDPPTHRSVQYSDIARLRVDRKGNLRLYRRVLFGVLPLEVAHIFHPAGEWRWVTPISYTIVEVGLRD